MLSHWTSDDIKMRDTIKNPYEKITLFKIPWLQCYLFLVLELLKPTTFCASTLAIWKQQQHYVYSQETCIHYYIQWSYHSAQWFNAVVSYRNTIVNSIGRSKLSLKHSFFHSETFASDLQIAIESNDCFKHYPSINWLFSRSNLNKITWNSIQLM